MTTSVAIMAVRLKPLLRHHRIAHLRALIKREPAHSIRREQLMLLLREQTTAQRTACRVVTCYRQS